MSYDDLKEQLRRVLIKDKIYEADTSSKIPITPEDAKDYYDRNIQSFQESEQRRPARFWSGSIKMQMRRSEKSRDRAEHLLKKARVGEDFAATGRGKFRLSVRRTGRRPGPIQPRHHGQAPRRRFQ
jgi:hypothetical protein